MMNPRKFHLRRGHIHLCIQVALLALCVRMAVIQCLHRPRYISLAEGMERSTVTIAPKRGRILDRNGQILAATVDAQSVWLNPQVVPAAERSVYSAQLAEALDIDAEKIARRIERVSNKNGFFIWVKRKISSEELAAVKALELPGIGFRTEGQRRYPKESFLCHVLGFVDTDDNGLEGLEHRFDSVLKGIPGEEAFLRDGRGRKLGEKETPEIPVEHGRSLVLTIDSSVQLIMEEELDRVWEKHKPETLSAVAMDPWTGDILAMASRPTFNPVNRGTAPASSRQNIAVTACVEPGSSFKPFVAATALAYGVVTPDTVFNCRQGKYRIGRRVLNDAHPLGNISVRDVMAYSSNIGMAQIVAMLTKDQLHDALRAFGFGAPTGIILAGESAGIVRPVSKWSKLSMTSLAMGQEVATSTLQLTAGFCVFANGGWYVQPRLMRGVADHDGAQILEPASQSEPRRVLSESIANTMCKDLLTGVIERGTARRAAIDGYRLAGKTGTAQIARVDGRGYELGAYSATFVGIAPADNPLVVIGLIAKHPKGGSYYGGVVAAPAVSRMSEKILSTWRVPRTAPTVRFASTH